MRTPAIEPSPPEYPTNHVKMYCDGSSRNLQGCIRTPRIPVISPPVLNRIQRGNALAKSFAGETTLAAMFTASVATTTVNIETATTTGWENFPTSTTGSQIGFPKMITVALVMRTPIAAKRDIVVGSATACP